MSTIQKKTTEGLAEVKGDHTHLGKIENPKEATSKKEESPLYRAVILSGGGEKRRGLETES